jgi:hypothetical protein
VRTALDGLGLFATGFAKMRVQVNESRTNPTTASVNDVTALGCDDVLAHFGDTTVDDEHVTRARITGAD